MVSRDNTIVEADTQTMRCTVCGDVVPIPLGALSWCSAVMLAFAKAHKGAKHAPGRTAFTVPRAEQEGKQDG
jgi:hypothetical protein